MESELLEKDLLWQSAVKNIYGLGESINLDTIIEKIHLKNPRPAFNIFTNEMKAKKEDQDKEKDEPKGKRKRKAKAKDKENDESKENDEPKEKEKIMEQNKKLSEEYKKLDKKAKAKYAKEAKKERNKYEIDMLLVNKFLFLNYTYLKNGKLSAYELYKNDKIIEAYEKNNDINISITKKNIWKTWKTIAKEEKEKYEQIKKRNELYLLEKDKMSRISAINMYVKTEFKKNNKNKLAEISKRWKTLDEEEKNKFKLSL